MMWLFLNKFVEDGPSPGMVHGWDVFLLWLWLWLRHIKILRGLISLCNLLQGIDIPVIDTAVQGPVKSPDHHHFRPLTVMHLKPPAVQHPVVVMLELDAVPAIHGTLIEHSKNQIDFFI